MKRLLYAAGLFSALAATQAYSQTPVAQAKIPFAFQVGEASMPSGEYLFSESGSTLVVRNTAGQPAAMASTLPASRSVKATNPSLVFDRYGDNYFLVKVWTGDAERDRALPKSKREKELARHEKFAKTSEIALQTKIRPDHDAR